MKYVVVILGIVLLAWAPGMVSAQGWSPGCGVPMCAPPAKKALSPALYIGYAGTVKQGRGLTVAFDGVVNGSNLRNYRWDIGFYGLQVAAELPYQASDKVTVLVSGSWFVNGKAQGVEERFLSNPLDQVREWTAKPQWYFLNAAAEFKPHESTAVIAGFMYDNTSISLINPDVIQNFGWRSGDNTDISVAAYIPYIGVSGTFGGLTGGVVFAPYVFGDLKMSWNETFNVLPGLYETSGSLSRAYFLQSWLEFNTSRAGANFGVYAAYNYLHANGSTTFNVTATSFSGEYNATVDRQIWMLGGKFALEFNLPLFRR